MSITKNYGDCLMHIGGEFVASDSGEWMDSVNPATGEVHGRVPAGTVSDVARAVAAAKQAQPEWAALHVFERGRLLRKLAEAVRARTDVLPLEVADTGNTIGCMAGHHGLAADYIEFVAGLGIEIKGESVPATPDKIHFTMREPYGVVGRIVPFNHPFLFSAAHLGAPLIAGNGVVLKSPDQSPLSTSIMAEICAQILPPGLVNFVSGHGAVVGDALVRHPDVPRIGFTGSVGTGMAIQRAAAETAIKHVTLELGGKNPFIAFPDSDPEEIATAAVNGMNFSWSGQSCGSTSRLMLHESLYDDVVERVRAKVSSIQVGDPQDPESGMGPVNSEPHYRRILDIIASAKEQGATVIAGGGQPAGKTFERGFWVEPTVFGDVTMDMRVAREEIFGPVLSVLKWQTVDEAIAMANELDLGLTAAVWTNDLKAAMSTVRALQSGLVWVNGSGRHYMGTGFGGWKNSGLGREECLEEVLSYTRVKAVHII
ncbi:MAG: aldehyde dehydrogenase family protein [Gammaproteobacteria bacterium]|jgi:acyl-CoA reductase-like NAD-dependent aldehyde dehydrogenase|nr:aldehyde dehydrogenase family protein [Gammaproteobacteria bacterium]MDP7418638.1 aldehyde dehydrogenase family protein [Gammaproteobacteria bacterium]MDP7660880.1 aldehyde dehydrogenase family protein [Gammaproteobacteria bacterium]HJP37720.1 aldehyde dehydrogenase family protein [Gammaproteobacteria bacterium]